MIVVDIIMKVDKSSLLNSISHLSVVKFKLNGHPAALCDSKAKMIAILASTPFALKIGTLMK